MSIQLVHQIRSSDINRITRVRTGTIQRKCCEGKEGTVDECEDCRKNRIIQKKSADSKADARLPVSSRVVCEALRFPGQPLDDNVRAMTENRTGFDFSRVRVHTDAKAAESAKAVGAIAYTVGHDVFFSHGSYKPQTESGLRLLTHELAHTLQQAEGTAEKDELEITSRGDPTEAEAENFSEAAAAGDHIVTLSGKHQTIARQVAGQTEPTQKCVPAPGIPNANCGAYLKNSWWLPWAYVRNATCACETTPNVPTANCVRKFLQDRLAATPMWLKVLAASQKGSDIPGSASYPAYQLFVQSFLTPRIYHDHVDAYRSCCCPSGPAPYGDWVLTTLVPSPACSLVDVAIRYFGSCSGTPGSW